MAPKLVVRLPHSAEKIFELKAGTTSVGRTPENDVCVPDKNLSRYHARFEVSPRGVLLVDLGSKNGTFVDGARIDQRVLGEEHVLRFGELAVAYSRDSGEAPSEPTPERAAEPNLLKTVNEDFSSLSLEGLLRPEKSSATPTALHLRAASAADRDRDKLRVLLRVSQLLSAPAPVDDLLASILALAFDILDIDRAVILLSDPVTGRLDPRTARTRSGPTADGAVFSGSVAQYVMKHRVAALFADATVDPRLAGAGSVMVQSIRTSMGVPLKTRDRILGVLYVDNITRPNRFGEEDLEFLSAFGSQAAIAIENALLSAKLAAEAVTRNSLLRFFSPAALPAVLQQGEARLGAVELDATALFCDICGYTEMSSRMKPTAVIELLNEYFPVMAEIVFRHEGTLEKYIGDALLAVWGAPLQHADDPIRAVRAAVDMQRAVRALNAAWGGQRQIAIHIGINSGVVAAGNIGSKDFIQYATIGDATNLASRLCGLAGEGEIVVGSATASRIQGAGFRSIELPRARVKGKEEELTVHRISWDSPGD